MLTGFSVNQRWYITAINFKRGILNNYSTEVGHLISWEAPVPGFVKFDRILHCFLSYCVFQYKSAWLAEKTKSQVVVDKYKYKSSTSRGQSASSLWRTRVEANLEMGRASLEKTGELSEEQETYFIIPAVSIFINILCHFFYSFEIAKTQKMHKRHGCKHMLVYQWSMISPPDSSWTGCMHSSSMCCYRERGMQSPAQRQRLEDEGSCEQVVRSGQIGHKASGAGLSSVLAS